MFEGDTGDGALDVTRIRSVDTKRVSANTLRMRHQTSRRAALEAFDLDRDRDFLRGVTGAPTDTDTWGSNVTGTDSLTASPAIEFAELPTLCRRLLSVEAGTAYRVRFGWIDDVQYVTDDETVNRLEELVVAQLQARHCGDLELGIPEVVEWSRIHQFVLPLEKRPEVRRWELRLPDYLGVLIAKSRLSAVTVDLLKGQYIEARDAENKMAYRWPVWRCLAGEIRDRGRTYVLDEGDFYEVNSDYHKALDAFIEKHVPLTTLQLPDADRRWNEDTYNREAARTGLLLMDKRTVRVTTSTTPVEVCDLLSPAMQFVHVKRKLGSPLLSHLFAQGAVSAELLRLEEFRKAAAVMSGKVIAEQPARDAGLAAASFQFLRRRVTPRNVEVVYGIIADWKGATLAARLPFFSKITLRRTVLDLERAGFKVTHARIDTK